MALQARLGINASRGRGAVGVLQEIGPLGPCTEKQKTSVNSARRAALPVQEARREMDPGKTTLEGAGWCCTCSFGALTYPVSVSLENTWIVTKNNLLDPSKLLLLQTVNSIVVTVG